MTRRLCVDPTAEELLALVGLHRPVGIRWAAILTGATQAQIRQWKARGHLEAAGVDERGRPTYTGLAVLRALALAEANTARTQGPRLATRRESVSA